MISKPSSEAAPPVHAGLRDVVKVFPSAAGGAGVHALGPLDLDLRKGEFFAVVGPSGCGKSTLLELIAGLATATKGTVTFEGRPVDGSVPDGIGVVFQEDASIPWLTVERNIAFGLRKTRLSDKERRERVAGALRMMGLADFAQSYPAQLSGGMRQRVCIARTLVMQPRLILLDEPFGALDQQTRLLMGEELLKLWRETGATIFLITHALDEAAMLADRIGVMSARPGRLLSIIETRWPRDRDSRIVEDVSLRCDYRRAVAPAARGIAQIDRQAGGAMNRAMKLATNPLLLRIAIIVALTGLLEVLCRTGIIDRFTMPPPSRIFEDLVNLLVTGKLDAAIAKTLTNCVIAFALAVVAGTVAGVLIHRSRLLRQILDPLFATYYAIPVFAFYPLFIILFGLGDIPQIVIAFMMSVIAMIVNVLNGLDRVPPVLLKTARMARMSPLETALRMTLPSAAPHLLTGAKLALAYAFIGIIGSEFIMSRGGMGFEIAFAYTNFDNAIMYPLIVLILAISVAVNALLGVWERRILARRGLR